MTERIECVVTRDPAEALITEQQFIRQYRPRFNVLMRDDKTYPFIAISLDEDYPRVYFTREKHKRGRKYFGPYSDARRARNLIELLGKIFQYRTCEGPEPGRQSGNPCLDFFIKRCQAPCVGLHLQGRLPRQHRSDRELSRRQLPRCRIRARRAHARRRRASRVRRGRALPKPHRRSEGLDRSQPPRLVVAGDGRPGRDRDRRLRGQRPGLPGPRRHPRRPQELSPGQHRRGRRQRGHRGVHRAVLHVRRRSAAAGDRRPATSRSTSSSTRSPACSKSRRGSNVEAALGRARREAQALRARRAQRPSRARTRAGPLRARASLAPRRPRKSP